MSTIEVTSELPLSLPTPVRIRLGTGVAGKSQFVTLREIGSGRRYRSQEWRNLGRALDDVMGRIHAPVKRAS